ncbi:MAG: hypothetical protein K6T73_06925 [Candidatus Bathyarchaeota archaeon]|nr:hypothetical protein [Candidatus Bathyarchaeota archaeon]
MKNCPYQKTDNKGLLNCIKGDSHIGLCQNPCPYETTASATEHECSTLANKHFSRLVRRKRRGLSSVQPVSNMLHFLIEAVGVE